MAERDAQKRACRCGAPHDGPCGPDPGSFGGHPYTPREIELGYGTDHDPRFADARLRPDSPDLSCASGSDDGEWLVITSYEGKVVTSYDTREEAEAAVNWLRKTYPSGPLVEYCRAR